MDLFNKASEKLKGKVDYRHTYVDFSQLEVTLPKKGGGSEVVKTCPAAMGFGFAAGTTDGPGAFDFTQGDDKVTCKCNISYVVHVLFSHYNFKVTNFHGYYVISGKSILEVGAQCT